MSHFTVLVVTKDRPVESVLEAALVPFHEFECTGMDNEYVQNIDQLAETRAEYETSTVKRLRDPEGTLHEPYEDQFYRDPTPEEEPETMLGSGSRTETMLGSGSTASGLNYQSKDWDDGRGYRPKVRFVPEGWTEITLPRSDVQPFAQFLEDYYGRRAVGPGESPDLEAEHKYGWFRVDPQGNVVEAINRTNPNRKWDWWQLGGRWNGEFRLKPGAQGLKGTPSLLDDAPDTSGYDAARKGDIDWARMRRERTRASIKAIEEAITSVLNKPVKVEAGRAFALDADLTHDTVLEIHRDAALAWDAMRAEFLAQLEQTREPFWKYLDALPPEHPVARSRRLGVLEAFTGMFSNVGMPENQPDPYEWVRTAPTFSTFAFLRDGVWVEKGEVHMFGLVSEEKEEAAWDAEYDRLLAAVPDDHWLAVVDCHI